jgi:hypothetical protein
MPNKQEAAAHGARGPFDGHPPALTPSSAARPRASAGVSSQAAGKVASKSPLWVSHAHPPSWRRTPDRCETGPGDDDVGIDAGQVFTIAAS